jgi:transcription elongation factor GreA
MEKFPITEAGYAKLEEELKHLKTVERPEVIKAISEAREHGDLSENAEYHAAREKQSFIEGRVMELEAAIAHSEVIDVKSLDSDSVKFGATVELVDEDTEEEITYQIVGEYESDINQGLLSIKAPISRALIGKSEGDSIEVSTPSGQKAYEILSVSYK